MPYNYFKHIALGLVRRDGQLLLVRHRGRSGENWWLPGGAVEQGEELLAALSREFLEETGLRIEGTPTLAFVVQIMREREQGLEESVSFHFTCDVSGEFNTQDPDGEILSAHWIDEQEALEHLSILPWYDALPLKRWINGEAPAGTVYVARSV